MRELLQDYLFHVGIDVQPIDTEVHTSSMLAEFVRLEREAVKNPVAQEFWRKTLTGSRATSLESDAAHEAPTAADPVATDVVPSWLLDGLRQLATTRGVPMKSLLLAAHCVTLQRLSGEEDVTTGVVTHGRARSGGCRTGRWAVPQHDSDPAQRDTGDMAGCGGAPGPDGAREPSPSALPVAGDAIRRGPSTVRYGVQLRQLPHFLRGGGGEGVKLLDVEVYEQTNLALLATAGIDPRTQRLFLRVSGSPDRVTATQTREYVTTFMRVLAAIARTPEAAVDTKADAFESPDVTQQIAQVAAASPEAVALVTDDAAWTYAELDGAADRLAIGLLAAGMPPGARIGVMLRAFARAHRDCPRCAQGRRGRRTAGHELSAQPHRRDDRARQTIPRHLEHRRGPCTSGYIGKADRFRSSTLPAPHMCCSRPVRRVSRRASRCRTGRWPT